MRFGFLHSSTHRHVREVDDFSMINYCNTTIPTSAGLADETCVKGHGVMKKVPQIDCE
jgi:hypothetical protein